MLTMPTKFAAVDTETNGLDIWHGGRMFAAGAVLSNGQEHFWRGEFSGLRALLEDETCDKVFHNAKFDLRMLEAKGFKVRGRVWDTMIFAHLLDGRDAGKPLGLDPVSRKYLPNEYRKIVDEINVWFDEHGIEKRMRRRNFENLPNEILQKRNVGDARITGALFKRFFKTVAHHFGFLLEQEHELINVVRSMEDVGIAVDPEEIELQDKHFLEIEEDVLLYCEGVVGGDFNMNSREHQIELLKRSGAWEQLVAFVKDSPDRQTGASRPNKIIPKLDDWNLRNLHHPSAHMLLLGKAASKMRSTFIDQARRYQVDGVLHPNFNQLGTTTGRFSCSNPNLQNIPIEGDRRTAYTEEEAEEAFEMTGTNYAPHLKRLFVVRPGKAHIHSDKKQAEMAMLAHYTNSQTMMDIFASGESIHDGICKRLYGEWTKGLKTRTKAVVFGYQYGAGLKTLARKIGGTVQDAKATRNRLGRIMPELPKWQAELAEQVEQVGYLTTIHGRRHYLRRHEAYMGPNRMCQGSVGDEIKSRMIALHKMFKAESIDAQILLNIHDDIASQSAIGDLHRAVPRIYEVMHETSKPYRLPLASSLDITYTRWSDLKEVEKPYEPDTYLPKTHSAKSRTGSRPTRKVPHKA
jgi:DNA polymerase-1